MLLEFHSDDIARAQGIGVQLLLIDTRLQCAVTIFFMQISKVTDNKSDSWCIGLWVGESVSYFAYEVVSPNDVKRIVYFRMTLSRVVRFCIAHLTPVFLSSTFNIMFLEAIIISRRISWWESVSIRSSLARTYNPTPFFTFAMPLQVKFARRKLTPQVTSATDVWIDSFGRLRWDMDARYFTITCAKFSKPRGSRLWLK